MTAADTFHNLNFLTRHKSNYDERLKNKTSFAKTSLDARRLSRNTVFNVELCVKGKIKYNSQQSNEKANKSTSKTSIEFSLKNADQK